MHFSLLDAVLEQTPDRIVALKHVSNAEEYLQDHFPSFPVLPGVLMLEAMVHAARALLAGTTPGGARGSDRWVLGTVRALKYGAMVRPGDTLRMEVTLTSSGAEGAEFKGAGIVLPPGAGVGAPPAEPRTAVSGRFSLRPARVETPSHPPATRA